MHTRLTPVVQQVIAPAELQGLPAGLRSALQRRWQPVHAAVMTAFDKAAEAELHKEREFAHFADDTGVPAHESRLLLSDAILDQFGAEVARALRSFRAAEFKDAHAFFGFGRAKSKEQQEQDAVAGTVEQLKGTLHALVQRSQAGYRTAGLERQQVVRGLRRGNVHRNRGILRLG